mmetsp:Transcript_73970/g.163489  ORF Transcript_73970/g.163489 Transcript_73970/m.163489 type:complete len:1362 (-) Transcript_73970:86-4171(-)
MPFHYDVASKDFPDSDNLANVIAKTLQLKGFCVIDTGADDESISQALDEARELISAGKFTSPPEEVLDGILGPKGSAEICKDFAQIEGDGVLEETIATPGLQKLDDLASAMGALVNPVAPFLGLEMGRRSPGMLHMTGEWSAKKAMPLGERDSVWWLKQLVWHNVMCLQFLGPGDIELEMEYFDAGEEGETEPVKIELEIGSMVLLRADVLNHRVSGSSDNIALTCWFMPECQSAPLRGGTALSLSPTARKIDAWTMNRLKMMADNLDKHGIEEDVPEQWRVIDDECFKMDAPKTEKKGGRAIEQANKGDIIFGFTDMVDGVKWLRTMAIAPEYGQPVIAYILIEGDVLGLPITIQQVDDLPNEWVIAKNHLYAYDAENQCCVRSVACRFPSTWDSESFFMPFTAGPDMAVEVPQTRWNLDYVYAPMDYGDRGRTACKHGGFMDGAALFDGQKFGIPKAEVISMDPMQRHCLEVVDEGLARAGLVKADIFKSVTGVYVGAGNCEWQLTENALKDPAADMFGCTGTSTAIQSNRLSFALGLMGPSITITSEGASSMMAIERALISFPKKNNIRCCAVGLVMCLIPHSWVSLSWSGVMWHGGSHGRCKSFDESAMGYTKCDGIGSATCEELCEKVDDELVRDDNKPELGLITGAFLVFNACAGLATPSAAGQQHLITETLRQAHIAPASVDAVECHAQGRVLFDAVEQMCLAKILRGDSPDMALPMNALMSNTGNAVECSALGSLIRVVKGAQYGALAPMIHLSVLNPQIDLDEQPSQLLTETIAYRLRESITAVRAENITGTIGMCTFNGTCFEDKVASSVPLTEVPERIAFWPGGGGFLDDKAAPRSGYEIIGSWDGWKGQAEMEELDSVGEEKIYSYVVTLGVNCFEEFQILVDGKPDMLLHPAMTQAPAATPVFGPDSNAYDLAWCIDGRTGLVETAVDPVQAIADSDEPCISGEWTMTHIETGENEKYTFSHTPGSDTFSGQYFGASKSGASTAITDCSMRGDSIKFNVPFKSKMFEVTGTISEKGKAMTSFTVKEGSTTIGNYTAKWSAELQGALAKQIVEKKTENFGLPGTQYKVELHVAGRFRAVNWSRVVKESDEEERTSQLADVPEDKGKYFVVGSWNGWSFEQEMTKGDAAGTYSVEVKMMHSLAAFYIVRDGDWHQVIHPMYPGGVSGGEVLGPDEETGCAWEIVGSEGDIVKIDLQRNINVAAEVKEDRAVSWRVVKNEAVTGEEKQLANAPRYCLVGTMGFGREQKGKMVWNPDTKMCSITFKIGRSGEETFQILQDGQWNRLICPTKYDANPNEPHGLSGPFEWSDMCWRIGASSGDEDAAGENYQVNLHFFNDSAGWHPYKVDWERA